jgi:Kef-type K+ transport system membrane component KefB
VLPGIKDAQERLSAALRATAWSAVAAAAAVPMGGFLCAALFLWIDHRRGPIIACLVLAGVFLVVIVGAMTTVMIVRQRQARRARARASQPTAQWLRDPMVVTTAMQAARMLGLRRAAPAILLGAFIVGLVLSRTAKSTPVQS